MVEYFARQPFVQHELRGLRLRIRARHEQMHFTPANFFTDELANFILELGQMKRQARRNF